MRLTTSSLSCATKWMRDASYSPGRTRMSEARPMFFIARTTAAMLTGSCGSCRTTRTRESGSVTLDDQRKEASRRLTVARKVDPVATTTQRQLSTATHAVRTHVVHDHVQRNRKVAIGAQRIERNLESHREAARFARPPGCERNDGTRAVHHMGADTRLRLLGHDDPRCGPVPARRGEIELN